MRSTIDPEKFENVPFDSLVGEHTLDAVDESVEQIKGWGSWTDSANCLRFRLDGKVYVALEDPDDGYRSAMRKLFILDGKMKNVFTPVRVIARVCKETGRLPYRNSADLLQLVDIANGKVILEVGTDNTDDYYPCFVASWVPENMALNATRRGLKNP